MLDVAYSEALASLHCRSAAVEKQLMTSDESDVVREFDVIVVGAGIHEQIFQNTLRTEGDPLRVITLERGLVVSETTIFAGERVNSNSSVRSSVGGDMEAIPGSGNINNFPGGVLQLDDVSAQGLGPLGNFGKVATINRSVSPNPVVFGWSVEKVESGGTRQPFVIECKKDGCVPIKLRARAVVDARGIGDPVYLNTDLIDASAPSTSLESAAGDLLKDFRAAPSVATFPMIIHSKNFYECTSLLPEPYAPFAGRTVAVIGGGDSGKTIMEYLTRIGPNSSAYGSGVISRGSATTIWVLGSFIEKAIASRDREREYKCVDGRGQPRNFVKQTEYEKAARARYRPLGAKFPKDSRDELGDTTCPLIDPIPGRLTGVERLDFNKLRLTVKVNNDGGELVYEVDQLILATSLKPRYGRLYEEFIGQGDLEQQIERVPGLSLATSSPYAVIPCKKYRGRDLYFIGPGAGNFFTSSGSNSPDVLLEPQEQARGLGRGKLSGVFDIAENVVSIFALGPISEATARLLARGPLRAQAAGALVAPPSSPLTFRQTPNDNQLINVPLSKHVQLSSVLERLNTFQQQQLVLFRILWHVSGVSAGVQGDGTEGIEAHISMTSREETSMLFVGCRFEPADELQARLAADLVLQQLLGKILRRAGNAARQVPNVCVAMLEWSPGAGGGVSLLDVAASYIYIRPERGNRAS